MSNRPVRVEEHIKKLNPTAATLLGFLHRGPMTGWDLAQMAEMVIGDFWNVTRSQVYRELRTLEGLELVAADTAATREKRPYSITDQGRTAFATFINREPGPDLLPSPLLLMVVFGRHLDPARKRRFSRSIASATSRPSTSSAASSGTSTAARRTWLPSCSTRSSTRRRCCAGSSGWTAGPRRGDVNAVAGLPRPFPEL